MSQLTTQKGDTRVIKAKTGTCSRTRVPSLHPSPHLSTHAPANSPTNTRTNSPPTSLTSASHQPNLSSNPLQPLILQVVDQYGQNTLDNGWQENFVGRYLVHKRWTTEFKNYCEKIQKAVDFDAGGGSGGPGGAGGAPGSSGDASSGGSDRRKSQSTLGSYLTPVANAFMGAVGGLMGQEKAQVSLEILTPLTNSHTFNKTSCA